MNNLRGYPPGTKCVITRTPSMIFRRPGLGTVVTVGERFDSSVTCMASGKVFILLSQQIDIPTPTGKFRYYFQPVAWMRPLDEDTDESDDEIIAALSDVPAVA